MGRRRERCPRSRFVSAYVARLAESSVGQDVFLGTFFAMIQAERVALRIVAENSGIAPPVKGRLDLFFNFRFGEVLIEYVVKKLEWHHMVRSVFQRRVYFLNEGRTSE